MNLIGELIEIVGGGTPSKKKEEYWNGNIPWASVKDLKNDFLTSTKDSITEDGLENSASNIIKKNSILIATRMAPGKLAINRIDVAINQDLKGLYCKENLNYKYLFYYLKLKSNYFLEKSSGATVKGIKLEHIRNLEIPLLELSEQKRIAAILDEADRLRQKDKQLIEKYNQLSQSVFLDMFGDPVTNPKGWYCKSVVDVCESIMGGGTPSKNKSEYYTGNIPWVTPKDMKTMFIGSSIDKITIEAVNNSSTKIIPSGAILMVIRSGILKKKLPVAINTVEVTLNQDMKAFIPKQEMVNTQYLLFFFIAVQRFLLGKVRAVTADNIEFKQIKELSIPVPPIEFQNKFSSIITEIQQQKSQAEKSLAKSEELFQSLLQRAFKGEL